TAGDVLVEARNGSVVDALTKTAITTGADAVGVVVAFNIMGFEAPTLLNQSIDSWMGDKFEEVFNLHPARARAFMDDTPVNSAGAINVRASNEATLNAATTNEATALAVAFIKANAMAVTAVLASNEISSSAEAWIHDTNPGNGRIALLSANGVDVEAADRSLIDSFTAMGNTAKKNSTFGTNLMSDLINQQEKEYQFTDRSGVQNVRFGDRVLVTQVTPDYTTGGGEQTLLYGDLVQLDSDLFGGSAGNIFIYLGDDMSSPADLEQQIYSDGSLWKKWSPSLYQFMGAGEGRDLSNQNFSEYVYWKKLTDTNVFPTSVITKIMSGAGVGGQGAGGSSKSYYGMISRNEVNSDALSSIENVVLNAGGTVSVTAAEAATISASDNSIVQSNSEAYGGVVSLNMVLSQADAHISGSDVTTAAGSGGDVLVQAENSSILNATSTTKSKATKAVGVVLSINTVGYDSRTILFEAIDELLGIDVFDSDNSASTAYIENSNIQADGAVQVIADNKAELIVATGNEQVSHTKNDFAIMAKAGPDGMSAGVMLAINKVKCDSIAYIEGGQVTANGEVKVDARDQSAMDANSKVVVSTVSEATLEAVVGMAKTVLPESYTYTTASGTQLLLPELRVRIGPDYDPAKGEPGAMYRYVKPLSLEDLMGLNPAELLELGIEDLGSLTDGDLPDIPMGIGDLTAFGIGHPVDLGVEDYTSDAWEKVMGGDDDLDDVYPEIGNIKKTDARAFGVLVVFNDIKSDTQAHIDNSNVSASSLLVNALEEATIEAYALTNVEANGGSAFGEGECLAVNGQLVHNLLLSHADAYITNSTINVPTGSVTLLARENSGMDATVHSSTASGDTGVGIVLALNTMGWKTQDLLTQTLDALIGSTEFGELFDDDKYPSGAKAYIENSNVTVGANLSITALSDTILNATISNAAESVGAALKGASSKGIGATLASNMVNSQALAYVSGSILTVSGDLSVKAEDNAGIYANIKLVSSSITTNDGGISIAKESFQDTEEVDFLSSDGLKSLTLGDRVRLDNDYRNGGDGGSIYKYMGPDADINLKTADYGDIGYWQPDSLANLAPDGLNFTDSDALAVGGLVVRNDVRSQVESYMDASYVTAGLVTIQAHENAIIKVNADSTVEASGGSAFGEGSCIAVNGTVTTNLVLSRANAYIQNSIVTTTSGDVIIEATNTSYIDAKTISATSSGDTGVGVTLAFNTVGWKAQNLLFNAIDALIGDPAVADAFGNEQPAETKAYILDSTIDAAGKITLTAVTDAWIQATVSNKTECVAYALTGSSSLAVGAVLASNMVSSQAYAYINSTSPNRGITAQGGGISVFAQDNSAIKAFSKLSAISSSTNDFGISLAVDALKGLLGVDYTDRSGVRDLATGNVVMLDDFDYTTYDEPDELAPGERVFLEFSIGGGAADDVYEYVGAAPLVGPVDLDGQDFTNTSLWKKLNGQPTESYMYVGSDQTGVNLADEDYTDMGRWLPMSKADPNGLIPGFGFSFSDSDSMAFGGLVVRNGVHGDVASYINNANVNAAGSVEVEAHETATVLAHNISTVTSSGGSMFGEGSSMAVNAVIVTNLVLSGANAYVTNSSITASNGGDFILEATNTSWINAYTEANIESNGYSIGVVLAFNTIGWNAQNILFNLVDTLIGTNIAEENPAECKAYTENTSINAAGKVDVSSTLDASITAIIENSAKSISASFGGNETITVGVTLAMNKLSTDVEATIDGASSVIAGTGDIRVATIDDSIINASVHSSSLSVSVGTDDSTSVAVGVSITRNYMHTDMQASIRNSGSAATPVIAVNGDVTVSALSTATINAEVTALAIALAASVKESLSVSGSGALAFNTILGKTNAFIADSVIVGNIVSVTADSQSIIVARVLAAAVSVAIGGENSTAVAIGVSVARNIIGWDSWTQDADYTNENYDVDLRKDATVRITEGPLLGDTYKYLGADVDEIDLSTMNYGDRSAWEQTNLVGAAGEVMAYISNSSVNALVDLLLTALATQTIDAIILAAGVAIAGSGKSGKSVSVAGVYAENRIKEYIKAYINGDGPTGISAESITLTADDGSAISAIAGAASIAGSFAGEDGISVSIGLSIAINEITNWIDAFIADANTDMVARSGDVAITALSRGWPVFEVDFSSLGFTAADLDDASKEDIDDPDTPAVDEAELDAAGDAQVDAVLGQLFAAQGVSLPESEIIRPDWIYTTSEENPINLEEGDTVKVAGDYPNGGTGGLTYRFLGAEGGVDLGLEDYTNASRWEAVAPELVLSALEEGSSWILKTGDGATYVLKKVNNQLEVSKININAVSAAASIGMGISGKSGIAVSGAGAIAFNAIRTETNAHIDNSQDTVIAAGDVVLDAQSTAEISALVASASLAVGAGSQTGVGVSIGISIARNLIGYDAFGESEEAGVRAYIVNS
ncbi:MAG: hypothetical protein H8D34_18030, partial [Chloroflexi bacterium]|nr:hypothetical protein [Chloroflexota bacterium]